MERHARSMHVQCHGHAGRADLELRTFDMIAPEQVNHVGTLFASQALAMMDRAAFIAATRHARRHLTMTSREMTSEYVPVHQGQLVEIVSRLGSRNGSVVAVDTALYAEDMLTGDRRLNARGHFLLTPVDDRDAPALPASETAHLSVGKEVS